MDKITMLNEAAENNDIATLKCIMEYCDVELIDLNFSIIAAAKWDNLDYIKYLFEHVSGIDPHFHNDAAMMFATLYKSCRVKKYIEEKMWVQ